MAVRIELVCCAAAAANLCLHLVPVHIVLLAVVAANPGCRSTLLVTELRECCTQVLNLVLYGAYAMSLTSHEMIHCNPYMILRLDAWQMF